MESKAFAQERGRGRVIVVRLTNRWGRVVPLFRWEGLHGDVHLLFFYRNARVLRYVFHDGRVRTTSRLFARATRLYRPFRRAFFVFHLVKGHRRGPTRHVSERRWFDSRGLTIHTLRRIFHRYAGREVRRVHLAVRACCGVHCHVFFLHVGGALHGVRVVARRDLCEHVNDDDGRHHALRIALTCRFLNF